MDYRILRTYDFQAHSSVPCLQFQSTQLSEQHSARAKRRFYQALSYVQVIITCLHEHGVIAGSIQALQSTI